MTKEEFQGLKRSADIGRRTRKEISFLKWRLSRRMDKKRPDALPERKGRG